MDDRRLYFRQVNAVVSPCVQVCRIDPHSGLCAGCLRTPEEIGRWRAIDDGARRAILAQLPARRSAAPGSPATTPER